MLKLEIDEKFEELSYLYDLFENITRIDYVPLEYRNEIKQLLIKAYKDGNQEFEKIHEKLKRLEKLEKENIELKEKNKSYELWNEIQHDMVASLEGIYLYGFHIQYVRNSEKYFGEEVVVIRESKFKEMKEDKYKLKKAIEILENKRVDVNKLLLSCCVEEYNDTVFTYKRELTQDEFNLLKEVFGND